MNLRHINRGDIKEGGCSLCKPRMSRRGWTEHYYGTHPSRDYDFELEAEAEEEDPQPD